MEPKSLARQQVLVGRLLEEGVSERVVARLADPGLRLDHVPGHRTAHAIEQLRLVDARHRRQEIVIDRSTGNGRHADDRLGVLWQGRDPREQDLAE